MGATSYPVARGENIRERSTRPKKGEGSGDELLNAGHAVVVVAVVVVDVGIRRIHVQVVVVVTAVVSTRPEVAIAGRAF